VRAAAVDDKQRVHRISGEVAFGDPRMRKADRAGDVPVLKVLRAANVEQHETRGRQRQRDVHIPAVGFELKQRLEMFESSGGRGGRTFGHGTLRSNDGHGWTLRDQSAGPADSFRAAGTPIFVKILPWPIGRWSP